MALTKEQIKANIKGPLLSLPKMGLIPSDFVLICQYLKKHPEITELNVNGNKIGAEGARLLAENKTLIKLSARGNLLAGIYLDSTSVKILATNTHLQSLDLTANWIWDEKAIAALAANKTLKNIILNNNEISDQGILTLIANTSLDKISATHNKFSSGILPILEARNQPRNPTQRYNEHRESCKFPSLFRLSVFAVQENGGPDCELPENLKDALKNPNP